jgi:hypothetical protein
MRTAEILRIAAGNLRFWIISWSKKNKIDGSCPTYNLNRLR